MLTRSSALLVTLVTLVGCTRQTAVKTYELTVRVESDPGQPLAGARLLHAGHELGVTAADGRVGVRASGNEGERIELEVSCPDRYRSPEAPLSVTLRRAAGRPEYFAACPPRTRKLVVAARLERGANLPIRHLGRELARTDAAGVAHLVVEGEREEAIELIVDTSEQPQLRPKSPSARFQLGDRDELVVLEQSFQSRQTHAPRPARPAGPVRIR